MGPPREHGGMLRSDMTMPRVVRLASMGPPREHGGMKGSRVFVNPPGGASMGPPREHGGMFKDIPRYYRERLAIGASMGPPREHGGMGNARVVACRLRLLQWGRRVNTAECWTTPGVSSRRFLLQWGRRVNTAE